MPAARPRRIVRRAVLALAVGVLLVGAWVSRGPSTDQQKAASLRLGMSPAEVRAIMGPPDSEGEYGPIDEWGYGERQLAFLDAYNRFVGRFGGTGRNWRMVTIPVRLKFDNRDDRLFS